MKFFVTGGGTAGHINPALAVAKKLIEMGHEIVYIGTNSEGGMDRVLVEEFARTNKNIRFVGLDLLVPDLTPSLRNIRAGFRVLKSIHKCRRLIKDEKPAAIIGTGGFVSLAMSIAGKMSGVPVAIHEQNLYPGQSNLLLSKFVDRVFLTFEGSAQYFKCKRNKLVVSGLALLNKPRNLGADQYSRRIKDRIRLLVTGGSNGSVFLNKMIVEIAPQLANIEGLETTLSTGRMHYEEMSKIQLPQGIKFIPYINDMQQQLEQTDIYISRAGSSTIFEMLAAGIPSVVIPSPNVVKDHQRPNAEYVEELGAGIMLDENSLQPHKLLETIKNLVQNPERLIEMKEASEKIQIPDALEIITGWMMEKGQRN